MRSASRKLANEAVVRHSRVRLNHVAQKELSAQPRLKARAPDHVESVGIYRRTSSKAFMSNAGASQALSIATIDEDRIFVQANSDRVGRRPNHQSVTSYKDLVTK